MLALSGLFVPLDVLPPWLQMLSRAVPLTHAVSLQRGIWSGHRWMANGGDVTAGS